MGNCDCKIKELEDKEKENSHLSITDFNFLYPIGRGGFGRVWKARLKRQFNNNNNIYDKYLYKNKSRIFAIKEMSKAKIYYKNSLQSVANERKFLALFHFPLLSNMYFAFQDTEYLYIVMDYLSGGDLRYEICKRNFFTQKETKFIASCIILSLEYIHKKNIIHRDLKPENLVFDSNGYLHLTDFGISMEYIPGKKLINSSGTPGYIAPEAISNKDHDFLVDYFALGVIVYELMTGERPYKGKTKKEIKEQMLAEEVQLSVKNLNMEYCDKNILDFINRLIKRKKSERLGVNGISEIKNHLWLQNVPWENILNGSVNSPFYFNSEDNFNYNYVNKREDESIYEGKKEKYIKEVNKSKVFKNFYYNIDENILLEKNKIRSYTRNTSNRSYIICSNTKNNICQVKKDENKIMDNMNNMKLSLNRKKLGPIRNKMLMLRKSNSHMFMGDNTYNNLLNDVKNQNNENKQENDIEIYNIE